MTRDVSGLGPSGIGYPRGPVGTPGAGTAAPVMPGAAVVRVRPVEPPPTASVPVRSPLERSGLDVLDVLGATDSLVQRRTRAPLAMEVALEQARGALVRQQPGDALAALDGVWDAAQHSEEGWYLRSGALLVLGLPGEGERVAGMGIEARPGSNALRWMQSLARFAVGDTSGARSALQGALQRLPSDPLLLAQQAVLCAAQGDDAGADAALSAAARRAAADHPAILFGRDAVRDARRNAASERARHGAIGAPTQRAPHHTSQSASQSAAQSHDEHGGARIDTITAAVQRTGSGETVRDPITAAVARLGALITSKDVDSLCREIRVLLRALSSGGTLGATGRPEQAHAARTLLALVASVLSGEPSDAPPATRALVTAVIGALRGPHPDDVLRTLRRPPTSVSESFGTLLRAFVDGALAQVPRGDAAAGVAPPVTPGDASENVSAEPSFDRRGTARATASVQHEIHDDARGIVVPVRLGLRLIDETPASRAAQAGRADFARDGDAFTRHGRALERAGEVLPDSPGVTAATHGPNAEVRGVGWGAAAAGAAAAGAAAAGRAAHSPGRAAIRGESAAAGRRGPRGIGQGGNVRLAAVACILIAAIAATAGYPVIAAACGIGAAWLALRRSTDTGQDTAAHAPEPDVRAIAGDGADVLLLGSDSWAADERSGRR